MDRTDRTDRTIGFQRVLGFKLSGSEISVCNNERYTVPGVFDDSLVSRSPGHCEASEGAAGK